MIKMKTVFVKFELIQPRRWQFKISANEIFLSQFRCSVLHFYRYIIVKGPDTQIDPIVVSLPLLFYFRPPKSAWIQMNCPIRLTVSIHQPHLTDEISCESSLQTLLYFEKVRLRYCDNPAGVSIFRFLSEPTAQKSIAKHRGAKSKQSAPKRGSSLSLASSVSRSSSQYERFSFQPVFQKRKKPEVESSW